MWERESGTGDRLREVLAASLLLLFAGGLLAFCLLLAVWSRRVLRGTLSPAARGVLLRVEPLSL